MKKIVSKGRVMVTSLALLLSLPMAAFADSPSLENPATQLPTAEKISFEQIMERVDDKMKDRLIEQRKEVEEFNTDALARKELRSDDVKAQSGYDPIDSYTYYEDNPLFYDVWVYNYTNADFGLVRTDWDYIGRGETESIFHSGSVKHTFTVYGVTTNWPPIVKSYPHSSGTETNKYRVSVSGNDYSLGHWITGLSQVEFLAGKAGEYYTFNW